MTRGFRWCLAGSVLALAALAGCGRSFLFMEEREAWRHEAEVNCLKSGAVKESAALVRVGPIDGPGICGADFPLKVAALGDTGMLAFADEPRPPGAIPNASQPRWPVSQPPPSLPRADIYAPQPIQSEPMPPAYPAPRASQRYAPPPQTYSQAMPPRYDLAAPGEPLSLTPPGMSVSVDADAMRSYPPDRAGAGVIQSYPPDPPATAPPPRLPALGPSRGPQVTGSVRAVEVKPNATLACPIVSALDQWIAGSVQPAAMRWFGQPVAEIKQISAYSCRGMNGQVGAKVSEHAFGNALDISAFTLADGRKIVVRSAWNGTPEEQGFLRDIQGAACQQFTTVLAPGSNIFHYDHIHVDLMRRSSGRQICQPAAIPGEVAAARAAARNRYARRGDPTTTGSIGKREAPLAEIPYEDDDHQWLATDDAAAEPVQQRAWERFRD